MSQPTPQPNPFAPPQAPVSDVPAPQATASIAELPVSDAWKTKFQLIEKAGGVKLPQFKALGVGERMKIGFSILAFLFGPFYYLAKGMWKKAISLFVVCVAVVLLLQFVLEMAGLGRFSNSLGYGVAAIFAARSNIDYYKKMVLRQNGWW
ncbi:DUF2628 domain-containing protein [Polaromonas sp. LjRoot131]|uniref:DUF2628 domain-containing protein n=1 Tax=Polaromonas sp. LjRoot131 TaxID=3342262 RepID=UPI003ECDD52E